MSDRIEIVTYQPDWPRQFDAERDHLETALQGLGVTAIEHFGSTAIPGLAAKPIIDILVIVSALELAQAHAPQRLAPLDYVFWADNPATDRLFFVKGMPPHGSRRTHHVHIAETGSELVERLVFRDYLRAHPTDAANYAVLKRELADAYADDREAYTRAKDGFIDTIMTRAMAWAANQRP